MEVDYNLGDPQKWTLTLLYTPDEDGVSKPMYGRTRIVKAMFLLQRKLEEEFGIDAGFDFRAYKYGPFDEGVYEALEHVEMMKFVTITSAEKHDAAMDSRRYELTEKGREHGRELWAERTQREQALLKWVRYKQADRPLGSLLSYIYTNYPDMTTESEISHRYS